MTSSDRRTRWALVVAAVIAVIAAAVGGWGFATASSDDADGAVAAASAAVTAMLTPDPADPDGYLDDILADSTGDQRRRLEQGSGELIAYVAALPGRPVGRVVSAGVESVGDDAVEVLLVAQTSDPALIGGDIDDQRVTLRVRTVRDGGRWLVAGTETVS